jgi:hypothetical protein
MKILIWTLALILSFQALAIPCDCEVRVHSPLTASLQIQPLIIKTYELEEYSNFSQKNINQCRQTCQNEFQKDMPADRLSALLLTYTQELIEKKQVGYNCAGLTTLKFPVRVRAKLGNRGLGNVSDLVQVVSHEEVCF